MPFGREGICLGGPSTKFDHEPPSEETMKTINARRHSIRDGQNDQITPEGIALAVAEGKKDKETNVVAFGPAYRTLMTIVAFLSGLARQVRILPPVFGLGDNDLFNVVATPEFRAAVKAGNSFFNAALMVHGREKVRVWAQQSLEGLKSIFAQLEDGDVCTAVFHTPSIEWAAWLILEQNMGIEDMPNHLKSLNEMDGLVFLQLDNGTIVVCTSSGSKIIAERS